MSAPACLPLVTRCAPARRTPARRSGAETGNDACLATAATPLTEVGLRWDRAPRFGGLSFVTLAPDGGATSKTDGETGPKEISVASSCRTGELEPFAYTATRSGVPWAASQASSAPPTKPP